MPNLAKLAGDGTILTAEDLVAVVKKYGAALKDDVRASAFTQGNLQLYASNMAALNILTMRVSPSEWRSQRKSFHELVAALQVTNMELFNHPVHTVLPSPVQAILRLADGGEEVLVVVLLCGKDGLDFTDPASTDVQTVEGFKILTDDKLPHHKIHVQVLKGFCQGEHGHEHYRVPGFEAIPSCPRDPEVAQSAGWYAQHAVADIANAVANAAGMQDRYPKDCPVFLATKEAVIMFACHGRGRDRFLLSAADGSPIKCPKLTHDPADWKGFKELVLLREDCALYRSGFRTAYIAWDMQAHLASPWPPERSCEYYGYLAEQLSRHLGTEALGGASKEVRAQQLRRLGWREHVVGSALRTVLEDWRQQLAERVASLESRSVPDTTKSPELCNLAEEGLRMQRDGVQKALDALLPLGHADT